jgi:hypothetical protein
VCCWANAHTLPHGFWGRSTDDDEDGSSSKTERNALKRDGTFLSLSPSYYLLYYISNKVEDKLGWKKREEEDGE